MHYEYKYSHNLKHLDSAQIVFIPTASILLMMKEYQTLKMTSSASHSTTIVLNCGNDGLVPPHEQKCNQCLTKCKRNLYKNRAYFHDNLETIQ